MDRGKVLLDLLACLLAAGSAWAQDGVISSFRAIQDTVTLREPVYVEFTLRNTSSGSTEADLGFNRKQNFDFAITTPDRRTVSASPVLAEGFGATGRISLRPGETYRQVLLLNERYSFEAPGDYDLVARFNGPVRGAEKGARSGDPSRIRLTILPRDPQRLTEICEALAAKAVQGSSYVEARDAAVALSYVQDPVAVPFLGRVLRESKLVRSEAADGLARIATPEAVEVLNSSSNSSDTELAAIARSALAIIDRKNKEADTKR